MKNIILLLPVFVIIVSCANRRKDNNPLKITVEITGKKMELSNDGRDSITTYPFEMSIRNQTDTTFRFWLMTCSREDNIAFNTRGIRLFSRGCDHNFPELIELSSGNSLTVEGEFEITDINAVKQQKDLRLALILFKKNDDPTEIVSHLKVSPPIKQKRRDLIWCDKPIKLNW